MWRAHAWFPKNGSTAREFVHFNWQNHGEHRQNNLVSRNLAMKLRGLEGYEFVFICDDSDSMVTPIGELFEFLAFDRLSYWLLQANLQILSQAYQADVSTSIRLVRFCCRQLRLFVGFRGWIEKDSVDRRRPGQYTRSRWRGHLFSQSGTGFSRAQLERTRPRFCRASTRYLESCPLRE